MVTERHDRGQLILITAIAVAFILLAIVIVFNGLLFTQTIASEDASKATTDVKTSERELEEGIQGIVLRANLEGSDWENPAKSYVAEYRNATGATKPAIVNVTEYRKTSDAKRISGDLPDGDTKIVNETGTEVGHLLVEVGTDDDVEISMSGNRITIDDGSCIAIDEDTTVRFDLVTGFAIDEDGNFLDADGCGYGIDPASSYDEITVANQTDSAEVSYILVVEGDEPDHDVDLPTVDDVPWGVELTYTYDSSDVTATRTITIENVYEDAAHVWPGGESP